MKNLHDKFVKDRLLEKQNAIDFLQVALPKEVSAILSLDQLVPTQNSFVTDRVKELFSDVVYQCKLTTGDDVYCCILIEHKSYKDPLAAFQIGSYLFEGYRQQIKNRQPFRVIIPLIFYHHEDTWVYKPVESFFVSLPEVLHPYIPKFDTIFFDVKNLSDQTIMEMRNAAWVTMFLTQKHHTRPEELLERIGKIYESLQTVEERNSFEKNIVYVLMTFSKNDHFFEIVQKEHYKPINKVIMTIYEQAITEGLIKGKTEGRMEGRMEGKTEVILALFEDQIPLSLIARYTKLTETEVKNILIEKQKIKE